MMILKTDMLAGLRYRQKIAEGKALRAPSPEIREHHQCDAAEFKRRAEDLAGEEIQRQIS